MSQEMRPDGSIDTSYYTRDTGKRLNSLAAVLRYLRVRLPAHTHTCPPARVQPVQGGCREGAGRGGARVQRERFGKEERARVGLAVLARRRARGARGWPGLGPVPCGAVVPWPYLLPYPTHCLLRYPTLALALAIPGRARRRVHRRRAAVAGDAHPLRLGLGLRVTGRVRVRVRVRG